MDKHQYQKRKFKDQHAAALKRHLLHQQVLLENSVGGGRYVGEVVGFRPGKICITRGCILTSGAPIAPKRGLTRWFRLDKVHIKDYTGQDAKSSHYEYLSPQGA